MNKYGLVIVLMTILALLVSGACAKKAPAPEEAKGEILIGILDDFSGMTASVGSAFRDGTLDCIRYINEEKGGIKGHQLRAIVVDHKWDGNLIISGWDRLQSEGVIAVFSATAALPVFVQKIRSSTIPTLTRSGSLDECFPVEPSYFFCTFPQALGTAEWLCQTIEREWSAKGESRPLKLFADAIAVGNFSKNINKALKWATEKRGWPYMMTRTPPAPIEVTTQVLQAKQFGADYLMLYSAEQACIAWLKDLDRQGYKPTIYAAVTFASPEVWTAVKELATVVKFYQACPSWGETDLPVVKLVQRLNTKWNPELGPRNSWYIEAFTHFLALEEALNRGVDKTGYASLNGAAVKEAMESMKDFDVGSGNPYTWTTTDHQGLHAVKWYQYTKDGISAPVSDWYSFPPLPQEQRTEAWWLQQ